MDYSWLISKLRYVLCFLYFVIALVAIIQFIRVHFFPRTNGTLLKTTSASAVSASKSQEDLERLTATKRKSAKPKWLYFCIFLCGTTRGVLNAIPFDTISMMESYPYIQIPMDFLPELLFFTTYLLLLLLWIEMYYFSKTIKRTFSITRRLSIVFVTVNGVVYGVALIISMVMASQGPYSIKDITAESIYLAVLSIGLAVFFPFYGFLLFRTLRRAAISSVRKQQIVQKLLRVLITCICCFVIHAVYILLLPRWRSLGQSIPWIFGLIWFLYGLITEILPVSIILLFISTLTFKKSPPPPEKKPLLQEQKDRSLPIRIVQWE